MGALEHKSQRRRIIATAIVMAAGLAGCADSLPSIPKIGDLNPFAEKQQPLPGKRIPVMQKPDQIGGAELATASIPVALPPAQTNEAWTQPGGSPNNVPGHLALSGSLKQTWSASAGTGSSSSGRITASPIVYEGRVYTLDATAKVSAFSASGGSAVWRTSLVPEHADVANAVGAIISHVAASEVVAVRPSEYDAYTVYAPGGRREFESLTDAAAYAAEEAARAARLRALRAGASEPRIEVEVDRRVGRLSTGEEQVVEVSVRATAVGYPAGAQIAAAT